METLRSRRTMNMIQGALDQDKMTIRKRQIAANKVCNWGKRDAEGNSYNKNLIKITLWSMYQSDMFEVVMTFIQTHNVIMPLPPSSIPIWLLTWNTYRQRGRD
jgi:hypothetical protein